MEREGETLFVPPEPKNNFFRKATTSKFKARMSSRRLFGTEKDKKRIPIYPLCGKEKLIEMDSALIDINPSSRKVITMSCFSRPETFEQKLHEIEEPVKSNDENLDLAARKKRLRK
eukprot:CAMPEP_0116873038 /NCGR_PEP_ID=MMETSP0463-20121206/3999_1 /TAXON_ID=181622 /ORGANISM="Strombidinopsis sp, Strain SopsisLIS2011" /LENGTH=115 /DNA_ID=CAMNT_0004514281 /DNA_START=287 /DNA_END=634 /DNA_ORIENTATION=+